VRKLPEINAVKTPERRARKEGGSRFPMLFGDHEPLQQETIRGHLPVTGGGSHGLPVSLHLGQFGINLSFFSENSE
jgi:hypothetical protein